VGAVPKLCVAVSNSVLNEVQTSYNRNIRKNYAGIGYTYDATRDAFIPPKPFDSWSLNETTCSWDAPIPVPVYDKLYDWDEAKQLCVERT